jgi:single-stranded-DNA-specific exonuclease
LIARGITDQDIVQEYLYSGTDGMHDPFLFRNMERAVATVKNALAERRNVLIHGDYDVDGISGTALLYLYFEGLADGVYRFLPDRRKDGYGLADRAVDWAGENDIGLVIAVDCGTSDGDLVAKLERSGIDVIVCDHHEFPANPPPAGIILNPLRDAYPFAFLSGAGVAFKLTQALSERNVRGSVRPEELIDLVALATISDLVPLVDENRYLARAGLEAMNGHPRPGLEALRRRSGIAGQDIDAHSISYRLAPRLNAPGRVASPKPALELLCATGAAEAERLADELERENDRRKQMTEFVHRSVARKLESERGEGRKGVVLADKDWDEGVLGIAASRVVDVYGAPAILIGTGGEYAKGSGRSVPGINLKEELDRCGDLLVQYGGHAQAVGLTIDPSRVDAFIEKMSAQLEAASRALPDKPELEIDSEVKLEECSMELLDFLSMCQPFGYGNREPVWLLPNIHVTDGTRVGNGDHMKLRFRDGQGGDGEAIFFNCGPVDAASLRETPVDVACILKRGYFLNRYYPEIQVVDVRAALRR